MINIRVVFLAILPFLVASCGIAPRSAPVVERPVPVKPPEPPKAAVTPVPTPVPPKQVDSRGYYTVKKGDTLLQIALEFGQNYRDLVAWNDLANPNDIKVDQVLRVLPPEGGSVPQTGSVATNSGVDSRPLGSSNPSTTQKAGPRGEKRPYSEGALADMQKPDPVTPGANQVASIPSVPPKPEPPKISDARPAERPPEAANGTNADDDAVSWMWPADGKVITSFSAGKKGIDIAGKLGQPVYAAGAGKVLYAGSGIRGYGNLVILKHTNNLLSAYAHNKTIFVKEDQTVNKGQKIAEMGNSDTDAVKLHFEIRQQGKPVDPSKFLPIR
ncbi:peptidoglycan DD-metalloendopeptidase family protein [Noviherbaspirillum sp.]|uniref:peptidoglycan DD-metalloendopeptidase family protein n=1 Tax=Noviherbaspirillum sp. TaxID=1926288 RepID=UPI002FE39B3A